MTKLSPGSRPPVLETPKSSGDPVGAQRETADPVLVGPCCQHLVQLDLVALETHPGSGHVEAPDPCGPLADLRYALIPVLLEVGPPPGQRLGVVDPEVLLVLHLEAGVLGLGDDLPGAGQLAVREHVAVDERSRLGPV